MIIFLQIFLLYGGIFYSWLLEAEVVAMLWRFLISTLIVHAVVKKNKGKDPCVENKDTSTCKFCLAFTPEQLVQISTPSYKLKKEKREARKSETATPSKEPSELVDPANVSVIGVVGQAAVDKSPASSSVPPEKKLKKDKLPAKVQKSSDSSDSKAKKTSDSTDTRFAELDSKWSERFNRLEALLLLKTFNRLSLMRLKLHLLAHLLLTSLKILTHFSNLQGALAQTSLQKYISQPASWSRIHSLQLQSALARVSLLSSINQPASSHPTDRNLFHLHLSALARVPLQFCINQPASVSPTSRSPHRRTGTDTHALKEQSTSQPHTDRNRPPKSELSSTDPSSHRHKSSSKHHSQPHFDRPASTVATDTGSPSFLQRKDSVSSICSGTDSDFSD